MIKIIIDTETSQIIASYEEGRDKVVRTFSNNFGGLIDLKNWLYNMPIENSTKIEWEIIIDIKEKF